MTSRSYRRAGQSRPGQEVPQAVQRAVSVCSCLRSSILVATIAAPLLFSFYSSFTAYRLTRPETLWTFVGWRNYVNIFSDPVFWQAFGRTVLLLTIALNLEMLLGLGLALLVEKATRGQRLLRTLMMFPMMFSPILVGFQFKFLFNDNVGLINNALQSLGITEQAIPWLIDGALAFFAIVVAEVWSSTPVFAILILAGLLAMPREPIEAAKVDGCTPWQSFRYVTWPFIMPFAYIAMTIRSLDVGRAYDIVKIMTDGGPARRTELIWTLIGRTGLQRCAHGRGERDGLRFDPPLDSLHCLLLPKARVRAGADRGGLVTWR